MDLYERVTKFVAEYGEQYKTHLKNGGEPVKITLELHPYGKDGLQWQVQGHVPQGCRDNPMVLIFTNYIKEKILEACKPPHKFSPGSVEQTTKRKETET